MKGTPQDVPQQQEAEEPPRRPRERYEVEASDMTPELMERIVERIERGDHVYITKGGRRRAELNWTQHKDPMTDEEHAAWLERLRTMTGNPKAKLILTRADLYG